MDGLRAAHGPHRRSFCVERIRAEIERLGERLEASGDLAPAQPSEGDHPLQPRPPGSCSILGQTGPLRDFRSGRALLRYAGLNLRERQSGAYRGQTRLSKKGRPLLRKVLGQTIFPVLRRRFLYGPYYHRKREEGMAGTKAKVAVMLGGPLYATQLGV